MTWAPGALGSDRRWPLDTLFNDTEPQQERSVLFQCSLSLMMQDEEEESLSPAFGSLTPFQSGPISPQASGPTLQAIAMKEHWASLFAVHSTSLVSFSWLSFSAGDLKAAFKINVRKREVNVKRTSCLSLGKNYEGEAGVAGVWVTPTPSFTVWEMRPQRRNIQKGHGDNQQVSWNPNQVQWVCFSIHREVPWGRKTFWSGGILARKEWDSDKRFIIANTQFALVYGPQHAKGNDRNQWIESFPPSLPILIQSSNTWRGRHWCGWERKAEWRGSDLKQHICNQGPRPREWSASCCTYRKMSPGCSWQQGGEREGPCSAP